MSGTPENPQDKPKSSWINLAVDYGPLLVFFLAYRHFKPEGDDAGFGEVVAVTKGTLSFMVATVIALAVSKWRLGKVSPMLWLSTVLILGFGTLTVLLGDPFWIQVKPTAIYLLFAAVLFAGLTRGKPMLKYLLQSAFEGLNDAGWLKLSRNWAFFFLFLAVLNEVLRHFLSFDAWLQAKLWGVTALSFLFTFAQIPMLLKHGLGEEAQVEVEQNPPHD
ncbi:inner membrane-spanning protein YciB [Novosphingobium sp. ZN18A2]|uniref:inner membrane-spanning protein YciB n=1 Tax=Novosphingobium sp. ZN18A2 TaxID=3079861 RepID=UPI0030D0FA31